MLIRLFLLYCLLAQPAWAASLPASVVQALKDAGIPQSSVSVVIQPVDKSRPLLTLNASKPINPASTIKLLTTYAGLELLGPAYTWKTEAYLNGELKDGVLNGDLILKGYGDPYLNIERLQSLIRTLRNTGLRDIRGDLIIDQSWLADTASDPGAFDGKPYRAYNTAPEALLLNFKATQFSFRGDAASGKVQIGTDPALPQLHIINQIEQRQAPCADWKDRLDYDVKTNGKTTTVTFSGNYSIACGEKTLDLSVLDNASYVYALFRELWMEQGGTIHGNVKQAETPAIAKHIATITSPPLADVIRLINKYSNNVMARQMLLTIGAEKQGTPTSVERSIRSIREWLAGKNLDFPELVLENGAGLSRQESISAQHLGDLLLSAWQSPVMPELMSSLPITAVDGTLEKRLKISDVAGQAHLKTGSLDGVRAMTGYLLDKKGRRWVVVFVVNHANAGASRVAQDALLEWVYKRP